MGRGRGRGGEGGWRGGKEGEGGVGWSPPPCEILNTALLTNDFKFHILALLVFFYYFFSIQLLAVRTVTCQGFFKSVFAAFKNSANKQNS